jgi:hypothetical protein
VAITAGQRAQKDLEPIEIDRPSWRQLIEDWAETRTELPRVVEEAGQWRRLLAPLRERFSGREAVEGVVDLDGVKGSARTAQTSAPWEAQPDKSRRGSACTAIPSSRYVFFRGSAL